MLKWLACFYILKYRVLIQMINFEKRKKINCILLKLSILGDIQ